MRSLGARVLLCAAAAALIPVPALAQERREVERRVVVAGPSTLDVALAEREELKLTQDQVRRLEAIRADAERQAAAVLNAEQNEALARSRERLRAFRGRIAAAGPTEAECERSEDGRRVECRRTRVRGAAPGAAMRWGPAEFEVCERPADEDAKEEKCRVVRFRGGVPPMMMGEPGMMMFGPGGMTGPGMRRMMMRMPFHAPLMREVEECETDGEGKERCTVRRFHTESDGDAPARPLAPGAPGASCERKKDDKGNEIVTCERRKVVR